MQRHAGGMSQRYGRPGDEQVSIGAKDIQSCSRKLFPGRQVTTPPMPADRARQPAVAATRSPHHNRTRQEPSSNEQWSEESEQVKPW